MPARRIPLWIKVAYTAWLVVWIPTYWREYGFLNFLWFCDIANFVLAAALWTESPLLLSWQTVSVLLVQILWVVDFILHVTTGFGPYATGYMFDGSISLLARGLSFFHLVMPVLLLWGVRRLGHDRRAFWAQTITAQVVLPLTWLVTQEGYWKGKNLNWVWGPFDKEQHWMPPVAFLLLTMVGYPLILYLPTHLFLRWWARRGSVDTPGAAR